MKILVLGSKGMAGHVISLYLQEHGHDVVGFARQKSQLLNNSIVGDVKDWTFLKEVIVNGNFDAIINCIAVLNKNTEIDKGNAILINSYLPHFLVGITSEMKTRIIHMSTESVFCGNTGPYYEDSKICPSNHYGLTKALGEFENTKDLVLRNSVIGPDNRQDGPSLFNWFMKQTGSVSGYSGAMWTGLATPTLAHFIEVILETNLTGIINLVNNESISKFDLLKLFNKYFRNDSLEIVANEKVHLDMSLRSQRTDLPFVLPSYEEQIKDMKNWVDNHKELYLHYFQ